ncbi:hypothetical protein LDENG_00019030, partial [Lucifuga dentata]
TKSTTVIKKLTAHFARQGIPESVISDNGSQYTSQSSRGSANCGNSSIRPHHQDTLRATARLSQP